LSEEDADTTKHFQDNLGYFIAYKDLFSTWIDMGKDFNVSNVRDALSAFSRLISPNHKKLFNGIFDTLQTGLSKLGDNAASQSKAISDLIHLIKAIPMDAKQDYDVLGFIYEYLIEKFAANAGKKAGEFYTLSRYLS
jgi:type I restriction enzyme M protein